MKIKKIGIAANIEKEKIADHVRSLKKWLEERGAKVFLETEISGKILSDGGYSWSELARKAEVAVVLGGDGTILRSARYLAVHRVPILGINMGGLGYLTEVNLNEIHSTMELILKGKFVTEKRMMLDVSVQHGKTVAGIGSVLNDVVMNRGDLSRMNELEVEVDGEYLTTHKGTADRFHAYRVNRLFVVGRRSHRISRKRFDPDQSHLPPYPDKPTDYFFRGCSSSDYPLVQRQRRNAVAGRSGNA